MNRPNKLELWGGAECSICRIGEQWRDQAAETGHRARRDDLLRIKDLGIDVIRFPMVWEAAVRDGKAGFDFTWTDEQVALAQGVGIELIAGLVHHGSGPPGTSLLDTAFPDLLAEYAAAVAERYPHIRRWTPVNEPLTTARFSALYGHWYPHHTSFKSFVRALVNQCLATTRSMTAIREYIPGAQLIQTEDIAKTFATPGLQYQADHENIRRWLSLDLLFGRVDHRHPWHARLLKAGITPEELREFAEEGSPPDIIGVNYYLTSERYLTGEKGIPGKHPAGGNDREAYIDCEAIRIPELEGEVGLGTRLTEVWNRYGTPLAITEVHHGCTREEQLRWLQQSWSDAGQAQASGIDIRAMTVWSLFGNFDWRSLLTKVENIYDVGAFDIRSTPPRETALAKAIRCYTSGNPYDHPVLADPGWWQRGGRFYEATRDPDCEGRPILILGASGTLGQALARTCRHRGLAHNLIGRSDARLDSEEELRAAIGKYEPWAIINAAGYVRVSDAHREVDECLRANSLGPLLLARLGAELALPVVGISSDLVFGGDCGPYDEMSDRHPQCVYGASKALAEDAMSALHPDGLTVRTAAFFGPWDVHNFAYKLCQSLALGQRVQLASDVIVSPTYVPDLCHALLDLLVDGERGLWNLTNGEALSWHDFGRRVAVACHLDETLIDSVCGEPSNTSLISTRGQILRPLDRAIADFAKHARFQQAVEDDGAKFAVGAEVNPAEARAPALV